MFSPLDINTRPGKLLACAVIAYAAWAVPVAASLNPSQTLGLGPGEAGDIESADFNGDGVADLAIARGGTLEIRRGKPGAEFSRARAYRTGGSSRNVAIVDLDRDGDKDVVTVDYYSKSLSIFHGRGDGTFKRRQDVRVGRLPTAVAMGLINDDRRRDLAVTDAGGDTVSLLFAKRKGSYERRQLRVGDPGQPNGVAIADLNGDEVQDLVHTSTSEVVVRLGRGDGRFAAAEKIEIGGTLRQTIARDLDGDGDLDLGVLASGYLPSQGIHVLRGNGDGTFLEPVQYLLDSSVEEFGFAEVTDDAFDDLVASTEGYPGGGGSNGHLWVLAGYGDGTFGQPTDFIYDGFGGRLDLGDFDESGSVDVASLTFPRYSEEPVAQFFLNE